MTSFFFLKQLYQSCLSSVVLIRCFCFLRASRRWIQAGLEGRQAFPKKTETADKKNPAILNNKGIAIFEMLFLIVVFMVLFAITLGFWGAVHTATLQSVSARHYSFEVINNRTHFEYHRDWPLEGNAGKNHMLRNTTSPGPKDYHGKMGMRLFYISGIIADSSLKEEDIVTTRGLNFFKEVDRDPAKAIPSKGVMPPGHDTGGPASDPGFHQQIFDVPDGRSVNPLWLMTGYGICLNYDCGE